MLMIMLQIQASSGSWLILNSSLSLRLFKNVVVSVGLLTHLFYACTGIKKVNEVKAANNVDTHLEKTSFQNRLSDVWNLEQNARDDV